MISGWIWVRVLAPQPSRSLPSAATWLLSGLRPPGELDSSCHCSTEMWRIYEVGILHILHCSKTKEWEINLKRTGMSIFMP